MQSEPLILVVEDNTILRRVIVDALEERGYRIESAADFPEGAIKLRAAAPALLIADVNLPNGDGRNLKNLARATDIPVLLISALPHAIDEKVGVQFLQKPFGLVELARVVERLLAPERGLPQVLRGVVHQKRQALFDALLDAANGLRIVASRGFGAPFLQFFATVPMDGASACAAALRQADRIIVPDVTKSKIFKGNPSWEVMRCAGARAVQSTPIFGAMRRLIGVMSTHWTSEHQPSVEELAQFDMVIFRAAREIGSG